MSCLGNRYLKIWLPHECSCELLHPSKIDKNLPYIAAEAPHDGHRTEIQIPRNRCQINLIFLLMEGWWDKESEEREPNMAVGTLTGQEQGWSPAMAEPFPLPLCLEGKGVFKILMLFRVCSQLPVLTVTVWVLQHLGSVAAQESFQIHHQKGLIKEV